MIINIGNINRDQEKMINILKQFTIEKYTTQHQLKIESYTDRGIRVIEGTIYSEDLFTLLSISGLDAFFDNGLVIVKK